MKNQISITPPKVTKKVPVTNHKEIKIDDYLAIDLKQSS